MTRKGGIRTWTNQRGEGRLFSVDLADETGEIKATGFNDAVDRFFDLLEVDKVYYISKGSLRQKNPRFNTLKHEYELHFETSTVIELCTDASAESIIPKVRYDFVPIAKIEDVPKDAIVDTIGVVKECGAVSQVTSRDGRSFAKRDLTLVDQSGKAVTLTLWNEAAEKWDERRQPVLAAKGVKVSDFGGRSLSAMQSSTVTPDPDIPEAHRLRGWFDAMGSGLVATSISAGRGGDIGANDPWKDLAEIRAEQLGHDKADFARPRRRSCTSARRTSLPRPRTAATRRSTTTGRTRTTARSASASTRRTSTASCCACRRATRAGSSGSRRSARRPR